MMSVRARLALIQLILLAGLLIMAVLAWHTSDLERRSGHALAWLSRAERSHQNADTWHEALLDDLDRALEQEHASPTVLADRLAKLYEDTRRFQADVATLEESTFPPALHAAVAVQLPRYRAYVADVNKVVATATRDPDAAARLAPPVRTAAQQIDDANNRITDLFQKNVAALEQQTLADNWRMKIWIVLATVVVALLAGTFAAFIAASVRTSLRAVCDAARALATGNLSARSAVAADDEVGELAHALNKMADDLQSMVDRLLANANRDAFGAQLVQALEMAENEADVRGIVSRAMPEIASAMPMELLIAGAESPEFVRAAEHPTAGAPCCGAGAAAGCAAIRRGAPTVFEDSEVLNACPKLRGRASGPISAICIPVSFMGRAFGVLHAAGAVGKAPSAQTLAQLATLGMQAGARIGILRTLENTRADAYTDKLTGLSNRRALEQAAKDIAVAPNAYAVVMADLDHFKVLNDTYGHETGDRALRIFADVMKKAIRQADHAARWGGEEFLIVFKGAAAETARDVIERIRSDLAHALLSGRVPPFTASFGITDSTMAGTFEEAVALADEALYRSKRAGRDRGTIYAGQADPVDAAASSA